MNNQLDGYESHEIMTVAEAAEQLHLSEERIRQLLNKRTLHGYKSGRKWLIARSEIARYLDTCNPDGAIPNQVRPSYGSVQIAEIYSPLYEEVGMSLENVAEYKPFLDKRYGRPDYSMPLPADKSPGAVRAALIRNGKYNLIPGRLRQGLDDYYDAGNDDWNQQLCIAKLVCELHQGVIKSVTVEDDGARLVVTYTAGRRVDIEDLQGKKIYAAYKNVCDLDEDEVMDTLGVMQAELLEKGTCLTEELGRCIQTP